MCQAFEKSFICTIIQNWHTQLEIAAETIQMLTFWMINSQKKFYVSKLEQTTNLNLVARRQRISAKMSPAPQEYFISNQKSTCRWRHVGEETWVLMWPLQHRNGIEARQICASAEFETLDLLHLHIPWRRKGGPEIN